MSILSDLEQLKKDAQAQKDALAALATQQSAILTALGGVAQQKTVEAIANAVGVDPVTGLKVEVAPPEVRPDVPA